MKTSKGVTVVDKDEEFTKVNFDKLPKLNTVFQKGTLCIVTVVEDRSV